MLPSFKRVDTCAAEFAAETPYLYSSYDGSDESRPSNAKKVPPLSGRTGPCEGQHAVHTPQDTVFRRPRVHVRLYDDAVLICLGIPSAKTKNSNEECTVLCWMSRGDILWNSSRHFA